jgi:hypothetical protein
MPGTRRIFAGVLAAPGAAAGQASKGGNGHEQAPGR